MFVGHYAPAAALKPLSPKTPLWHLFIAVQFLDYLWSVFILTGVEKARIVPGFLEASDLDLYFMPYTHSLAAAIFWSLLGAALYRTLINARAGFAGAILIGIAIFSHWLGDLLTHAKDLALWPGSDEKLGLSLWSSLTFSKGVELGLFLGGFILYLGGTSPKGAMGRIAPAIVIAALIGIDVYAATAAPPADIRIFAVLALVSYTLVAGLAAWLDAVRSPRQR
ncbi:MAG: metal-dependent hydrolase [Pseudomonadota bacterium]